MVQSDSEFRYYFSDCEERCTNIKTPEQAHKKRFNPNHGGHQKKRTWVIKQDFTSTPDFI